MLVTHANKKPESEGCLTLSSTSPNPWRLDLVYKDQILVGKQKGSPSLVSDKKDQQPSIRHFQITTFYPLKKKIKCSFWEETVMI